MKRDFLKKVFVLSVMFLSLQTAAGFAQPNYDIKEMTPAIQQAIQNRQARYNDLQSMKASGVLGENNQGLVSVLQSSAAAETVAKGENADRMVIYQAIVDQNQLGNQNMPQVQTVFADVQRDKARPGDSIQLPSGQWTKK